MLKNFKKLIAEWRKSFWQSIVNWHETRNMAECSICHQPTLLRNLKKLKRLRWIYLVCPECRRNSENLRKLLYSCDKCKKVFAEGHLTEFRDNLLCSNCLNERSFYCPECHERVSWIRKFTTVSTVIFCNPCTEKFELNKRVLSKEAKTILEKYHREATKNRPTGGDKKSSSGTLQKTHFQKCARCRQSIPEGDEFFFEPLEKIYCKNCAVKLGVIKHDIQTVATCSCCGERVPAKLLSEIDNSSVCSNCLDTHYQLCPICRKRIAASNSFRSIYLLEYCNPCGKRLGLKRYIPLKDTAETEKEDSTPKKRKKKSEKTEDFQESQISSSIDLQPGLSDAQVLSMVPGGKKTSWGSILSEPPPAPPPKPAFSSNNYYHPEFDDNEEDDFVLDGIGGLDGKHDI